MPLSILRMGFSWVCQKQCFYGVFLGSPANTFKQKVNTVAKTQVIDAFQTKYHRGMEIFVENQIKVDFLECAKLKKG